MRMKHAREWYIPEGAKMIDTNGANLEIHVYESRRGQVAAVAFYGKAQKPTWNFTFRSEESCARKILESIQSCNAHAVAVTERAAERAKPHDLKVGDILTGSWGYDQTNIDWVEVIEVPGPRTVIIREIGCEVERNDGYGSDLVTPAKGSYTSEAKRKVVNNGSIKLSSWGRYCSLWTGGARRQTDAYSGH